MDSQPPVVPAEVETEAPRRRIAWRAVLRRIVPWIGPVLVAGLYLWLAFGQLPSHRYQINPDGVGYMSVARKYATGALGDAVNAYWSPLYSWLMVPLLWVGVEALLAAKLVGVGIGGATLVAMWRLMRFAGVQADVRTLACAAAVPLAVEAVYAVTTSDLLVACALLFYLGSMANPANTSNWARGAWIGVSGALAYLAKAYALPFVLGHFALVRAIEMVCPGARGERRRLIASSGIALAALGLIVGAWAAVLTHKYGAFTLGSTGQYNLRIDAPNSPGQVMHWAGFIEPSDASAVSVWDDITWHVDRMPAWNPLATGEDRDYLWKQIQRNFEQMLKMLEKYTSVLYPLLVIAGLVALSRADLRPRRPGLILAAGILLYPMGYLVLHVERRFLTPVVLMVLVAGMYAIARASRKGLMSGWWRRSLAAAVLGYTFIAYPLDQLERSKGHGEELARWAGELQGVVPAGAAVASTGNWGNSLFLSFYMDWRYYGEPYPRQRRDEILADLDRLGVEYLIAWRRRGRSSQTSWLDRAGWEELAPEANTPFALYRRPAVSAGAAGE